MKKNIYLAVALIAALVLSSCVLGVNGGDGGSVSLRVAAPVPKVTVEDGYFEVRVWVYSGNILVPGPSGPYHAARIQPYSTAVVTIGNLPPGNTYRIAVTAGWSYGSEIYFDYYGASGVFSVAAGAETEVPVSMRGMSTSIERDGSYNPLTGIKSLAVINYYDGPYKNSYPYAASNSAVYRFDDSSGNWVGDEVLSPPYSEENPAINSLSVGSPWGYCLPLVNTTDGIYLDNDGSAFRVDYWGGDTVVLNALQSDVFDSLFLYRTSTHFGGGNYYGETKWTNINLGASSGRRIFDFFVYQGEGNSAFFASNFVGAFIMPDYFLSESVDHLAVLLDPVQRSSYGIRLFSQNEYWGTGKPQIQAFWYDRDYDPDFMLIGTANGLYVAEYFGGEGLYEPVYFIPGTEGMNIRKIVFLPGSGVVCLTDSGVFYIDPFGEFPVIYPLPFAAEMVGTVSDIAFISYYDYTSILVAGSLGLVRIETEFNRSLIIAD